MTCTMLSSPQIKENGYESRTCELQSELETVQEIVSKREVELERLKSNLHDRDVSKVGYLDKLVY